MCEPTLSKIFRPVTPNTSIFFTWLKEKLVIFKTILETEYHLDQIALWIFKTFNTVIFLLKNCMQPHISYLSQCMRFPSSM